MSTTLEQLKTVIAELTLEEKTELANFLADSIDQGEARMGMLKLPGITSLPDEPTRYEAEEPMASRRTSFSQSCVRNTSEACPFPQCRGGGAVRCNFVLRITTSRAWSFLSDRSPARCRSDPATSGSLGSLQGHSLSEVLAGWFSVQRLLFELEDLIWIGALAHQKRKPGYWLHRQPP